MKASILLIFLFISNFLGSKICFTPKDEVSALEEFFNSTNGGGWAWRYPLSVYGNKWNFSDPDVDPCNSHWQGLTCTNFSTVYALSLASYNLNGVVPSSISNLSYLTSFQVKYNTIRGRIPSSLCDCKNLSNLNMAYNFLSGNVPDCLLNDLRKLAFLDFESNLLTGTIPEIKQYQVKMKYFSLSINYLHGSIPSTLALYSQIQELYIFGNLLIGEIPESFVNLTHLEVLALNTNYLSGSIPSGIYSISSLRYIYFHQNYLTGCLPPLGALKNLVYLSLYENTLTGPIPPSIADLTYLRVLSLDDNYFSGLLPPGLGELKFLQQLDLYACFFSGNLPQSLSNLSNVQILLLNENFFSGNPSASFNPNLQLNLEQVDFSNNIFTGQLPVGLFGPRLRTLASVQTCFREEIPKEICNSLSLESIVIDAIGSGGQCPSHIWPLIPGSPNKVNIINGGIPRCVWTDLKNLSILHAASNGLTGSIPALLSYGNLTSIDLSFNAFTGRIPGRLQSWKPLTYLNLQNNKFVGDINDIGALTYSYTPNGEGVSLYLTINRLSGVIPLELEEAYNINICNGNIFSCSYAHQPPVHNPGANEYVCGSNLLDDSLYVFGCSLGLIAALFLGWLAFSTLPVWREKREWKWWEQAKHIIHIISTEHELHAMIEKLQGNDNSRSMTMKVLILQLILWKHKIDSLQGMAHLTESNASMIISFSVKRKEMSRIRNVINFLRTASILRNIALTLLVIIFIFAVPAFPVLKMYYGSYEDQYQWTYSGVFFTGYQPAIFMILMWMLLLGTAMTAIKIYIPHKIADENESAMENNRKIDPVEEVANENDEEGNQIEAKSSDGGEKTIDRSSDLESIRFSKATTVLDSEKSATTYKLFFFRILWDGISKLLQYLRRFTVWISIASVMFNIIVVLALKSLFIYLLLGTNVTFVEKIFLETTLGILDLFWAVILVPAYINRLPKKTALGKLILKVCLLYFNNIIAPILVIGASDSSCFQGLFVKNEEQVVSFYYPFCLIYQNNGTLGSTSELCSVYSSWSSNESYIPAFLYNYTCYSTILKDYIPVFVLTSTFSIVMVPLGFIYLIMKRKRTIVFDLLPHIFWIEPVIVPANAAQSTDSSFRGTLSSYIYSVKESFVGNPILGDRTCSSSSDSTKQEPVEDPSQNRQLGRAGDSSPLVNRALSDPGNLFYPYVLIAAMLHDIMLLITYGFMCPWLAAAIVSSMCVTHFMWEILLSRYLCSISASFASSPAPPKSQSSSLDNREISIEVNGRQVSTSLGANQSTAALTLATLDGRVISNTDSSISAMDRSESVFWRQRYESVCDNEAIANVDKLCRNVWHGPKKCLWLLVYGSALFFALVTMDMAGDQQGWLVALWAPISILLLAFLLLYLVRLFSMRGKSIRTKELLSGKRSRRSNRFDSNSDRTMSSVELTRNNSIIFDNAKVARNITSLEKD